MDSSFESFIKEKCASAFKKINIFQLSQEKFKHSKTSSVILIDCDSCLHRLYGGFYPDYGCGGQWSNMVHYIYNLKRQCDANHLKIVFYIKGAFEINILESWFNSQLDMINNLNEMNQYVSARGLAPPQPLWIAPAMLMTALRMALRINNVSIMSSLEDHHFEAISYSHENNLDAIMGKCCNYLFFEPMSLYSAESITLKYQGGLEANLLVSDEFAKCIDIHPKRFSLLATLLGMAYLSIDDLQQFYRRFSVFNVLNGAIIQKPSFKIFNAVIDYIRLLESIDDLDKLGKQIFEDYNDPTEKILLLKKSLEYFMKGTIQGFKIRKENVKQNLPGSYPKKNPNCDRDNIDINISRNTELLEKKNVFNLSIQNNSINFNENFAEDNYFKDKRSGYFSFEDEINSQKPNIIEKMDINLDENFRSLKIKNAEQITVDSNLNKMSDASTLSLEKYVPEVLMDIVVERHKDGYMHPWIYQIIKYGQIKLYTCIENVNSDLPLSWAIYRSIRLRVYGVLTSLKQLMEEWKIQNNTNNEIKDPKPTIRVREWSPMETSGMRRYFDSVVSECFDWNIPDLRKLWLGSDNDVRLKTFFACMKCESIQVMLFDRELTPENLIIPLSVLRYIIQYKKCRILRREELDALLATFLSRHLDNFKKLGEIQLNGLSFHALHIASIFMNGIEHATFVNDSTGSPIPWDLLCPWKFFDGKLFQIKLKMALAGTSTMLLCDGMIDDVFYLERMRETILHAIPWDSAFAKISLPQRAIEPILKMSSVNTNYFPYIPAGAPIPKIESHANKGRGVSSMRKIDSRGGHLQIAGTVVGNWGPNLNKPIPMFGNDYSNRKNSRGKRQNKVNVKPKSIGRGCVLDTSQSTIIRPGISESCSDDDILVDDKIVLKDDKNILVSNSNNQNVVIN